MTRALFGSDGAMSRKEAYRMIDEAQKGMLFYRFVLSPDPKREDTGRDLDMRDITYQTMQALEERLNTPLLWVAAIHEDHAPHRHIHILAVVPKLLRVNDFALLRHHATEAALSQRRFLDLSQHHELERPYPLPAFAGETLDMLPGRQGGSWRSGYRKTEQGGGVPASAPLHGTRPASTAPPKPIRSRQTDPIPAGSARAEPKGRGVRPLRTCTCPRCEAVHVHNVRDPVHQCRSCGLILHRRKQPALSLGKEAGWQR
jgi:hypothetical protein